VRVRRTALHPKAAVTRASAPSNRGAPSRRMSAGLRSIQRRPSREPRHLRSEPRGENGTAPLAERRSSSQHQRRNNAHRTPETVSPTRCLLARWSAVPRTRAYPDGPCTDVAQQESPLHPQGALRRPRPHEANKGLSGQDSGIWVPAIGAVCRSLDTEAFDVYACAHRTREDGVNPSRTRRCNRDESRHLPLADSAGKARRVG